MAHFNEYLDFLELSPLIKHFLQNGKKCLYKKGEFFCQASEVCHNIAYISQGGFRYFYLDTEEDKHIIGYSFEKDFVVDYESFTKQTPALFIRKQSRRVPSINYLITNWKHFGQQASKTSY